MRFVNLTTDVQRAELLAMIKNYELVNEKVVFDERRGKPIMKVKEKKKSRIGITCEMIGGASRDNGFFVGTYFSGSLTEKNGRTRLKGVITTAPIYHTGLLALTAFFVYQCIRLGGFNPIPVILLVFNYFLFRAEYKKQGLIARYLERAVRRAEDKAATGRR